MDIPSLIAYTEERNKKAGSEPRRDDEDKTNETSQSIAEEFGDSTAEKEAMTEADARPDKYHDDVGFMVHSSFFHWERNLAGDGLSTCCTASEDEVSGETNRI